MKEMNRDSVNAVLFNHRYLSPEELFFLFCTGKTHTVPECSCAFLHRSNTAESKKSVENPVLFPVLIESQDSESAMKNGEVRIEDIDIVRQQHREETVTYEYRRSPGQDPFTKPDRNEDLVRVGLSYP
jgi:hypothetical protein